MIQPRVNQEPALAAIAKSNMHPQIMTASAAAVVGGGGGGGGDGSGSGVGGRWRLQGLCEVTFAPTHKAPSLALNVLQNVYKIYTSLGDCNLTCSLLESLETKAELFAGCISFNIAATSVHDKVSQAQTTCPFLWGSSCVFCLGQGLKC